MRGYRSNYEDLQVLIKDHQPACLCLQETMHGDIVLRGPRGYIAFSNSVPHAVPGTGLTVLVRKQVPAYAVPLNTPLSALAIRAKLQKEYTICNIYIEHDINLQVNHLENMIRQLPRPYILLRDFNSRHRMWGDSVENANGKIIEQFLLTNDAVLLNGDTPTHFTLHTGATSNIDLAMCSPDIAAGLHWEVIEEVFGSDHYPIIISETTATAEVREPRHIVERADWPLFTAVSYMPAATVDEDVDSMLHRFSEGIMRAADVAIPMTSGAPYKSTVPWWNEECRRSRAEKKYALRRYQRSRSLADSIALKRARAIARRTQRQARKQCWTNFISSINKETPINKVYKKIKKIQHSNYSQSVPCLKQNGNLVTDAAVVAQAFGEHFYTVSSHASYAPDFQIIKEEAERHHLNFATPVVHQYNWPISDLELKAALKTAKKTAPGIDKIEYTMIRHISESARALLLQIYNKIFLDGVFPTEWTKAILLPFIKPNKDSSLPSSYRPIVLTSCLCKLLEKIINVRLVNILESKSAISPIQYGFRKSRSTEDVLVRMQTAVLDAFALHKHVFAVFFDIEKAYDTTWRYGILREIYELGVRGALAFFICNFLRDRMFYVRVGNSMSTGFTQEQGTPQGSVLSCTLFLIAINKIASEIPAAVSATMYVDDLAIYMRASNVATAQRLLQASVNKIVQWASTHGYRLSRDKTVAVHFHNKRSEQEHPALVLYDTPIRFRDNVKFLGLYFDYKLTWKTHIQETKTKGNKALNLLKMLSHLRWGADRKSLLRIYRNIIRPKLDYGSQIYASAAERVLESLNSIPNAAIKFLHWGI